MNKELQTCSICGAKVQLKKITYTQEAEGEVSIVRDVPAQVCTQCGEQYLTPDTVDAIQEVIEGDKAPETRAVPVYHFPHPR